MLPYRKASHIGVPGRLTTISMTTFRHVGFEEAYQAMMASFVCSAHMWVSWMCIMRYRTYGPKTAAHRNCQNTEGALSVAISYENQADSIRNNICLPFATPAASGCVAVDFEDTVSLMEFTRAEKDDDCDE